MADIALFLWDLARILFFALLNLIIFMLIYGFMLEFVTCSILTIKEFINKLRK